MRIAQQLAQLLTQHKLSLSLAESCTGGLVSNHLTDIPGASAFLLLAIVAYDNQAKIDLLKVPLALIKKHGAVSEPVALRMAQGVRRILNTDIGIAITGIAGPAGGSLEKPVGTVFIAVTKGKHASCQRYQFKGSRTRIKTQAAETALKMLIHLVK